MYFKGYIDANEIDLEVAKANSTTMEWYSSKEDLYEWCGEDVEITEILIIDFELDIDGHIMTFENIGMN